jgi:BirA family biotin operon repressor/biotin-[acetyl-CoA-carboxylase] ligase
MHPTPGTASGPVRPPLDAEALRRDLLVEGGLWTALEVSASTGSTNADAAAAAVAGAPEGLVVTTEHQQAGRGRLDRRWEVPARSGLVVSVVLRPDVPLARWTWLPLLAGLAVDLTAQDCGVASGLKWPNDVLVDDRKLCGILLERAEGGSPRAAAVVGVGLNVTLTEDERPVPTATSLWLESARVTDRGRVLVLLLGHLERLYRGWVDSGGDPASLRPAYLERCVTVGAQVRVELPDGSTLEGVAEDVDAWGRLVVDGTAVSAGDVVHARLLP